MEDKKMEWSNPKLVELGSARWLSSGQPSCGMGYNFISCGNGDAAEDVCTTHGTGAVFVCTNGSAKV